MQSNSPFLSNKETAEAVIELGIKKAGQSFFKTFTLGVMAGIFVALGYLACIIAMGEASTSLNPAIGKLLGAMGFTMTLIFILCVGGDLFTGNMLIGLGFFNGKVRLFAMLKNWVAVWLGNIAGVALAAYFFNEAGMTMGNDIVNEFVIHVAEKKLTLTFTQIVMSGFFCNIVISLVVWASLSAQDLAGKILVIFFCVYAFVVTGYQHSIANMFIFSYAQVLSGNFDCKEILIAISGATLGNVLSGGIFIPIVYTCVLVKDKSKKLVK